MPDSSAFLLLIRHVVPPVGKRSQALREGFLIVLHRQVHAYAVPLRTPMAFSKAAAARLCFLAWVVVPLPAGLPLLLKEPASTCSFFKASLVSGSPHAHC